MELKEFLDNVSHEFVLCIDDNFAPGLIRYKIYKAMPHENPEFINVLTDLNEVKAYTVNRFKFMREDL
jgi:hypothetical protein